MGQAPNRQADESGAGWTPIIRVDRVSAPPGGTFVVASGRELAVFRLDDPHGIVVIDNACPHAHGNLAGGTLAGAVVECPWHQWRFDLVRGVCINSESVRLRKYEVCIRDRFVHARLDDLPLPPAGDELLA